jgi:hypothetical protein
MADEPKPPSEQKLTPTQKQYVYDWLTKKGGLPVRPCPVCAESKWLIADHIVAPMRIEGTGIALGGSLYPFVPILCQNCGNTHFINTIIMGLPGAEGQS